MKSDESLETSISKYQAWLKIYRNDTERGLKLPDERIRVSSKRVDELGRIINATFKVITKNYRNKSIKLPDYKHQLERFKPLYENDELLHYHTLRSSEIKNAIDQYLPNEELRQAA